MLQTLLLLCDGIQPGGQEGIRAFGEWLRGESTRINRTHNTLFWLFKNACKCCKPKILCIWLIAMILWSTSFIEYSVIYHKGTQHPTTLKS